MSIHIIAFAEKGKTIHAIADKRVGKGVSYMGELIHWEHVHDDRLKLQPITEKLYLCAGKIDEMTDAFYEQLLTVKHKKPSEIIEFAEKIDRKVRPKFWVHDFNSVIIFGVHESGKLFIWNGHGDGTTELFFGSDKSTLDYSGGLGDTADRAVHALAMSLKRGNNLPKAMVEAVHFAASIDKVISPTFDFVTLHEEPNEDLVEVHLLTAMEGKRIVITADENNLRVFNDTNELMIVMDDDSAIEGRYESITPPLLDLNGNYPKNYLGSRNNANGSFTYFYATMGPGMSVGVSPTDSNGFSTLGRKEIFTNGKIRVANADESQKTEISKTGITTTGNLEVGGNLTVNGATGFTGYELVSSSGPQTRKYIKGVYMGIGPNSSW